MIIDKYVEKSQQSGVDKRLENCQEYMPGDYEIIQYS